MKKVVLAAICSVSAPQFVVNNIVLRAEFTDVGDENTTGQSDVDVIGVSAAVKF